MPGTNSFFTATTGYQGEQSLIDNLVIEQIAMFGLDLLYMPRENINLDQLLHESTADAFKLALSIPMYLKSFDGYDNSMEMLTKFGVRSSDELTLVMSRSQWTTYYAPYVKSFYSETSIYNDPLKGEISRRPKEGDLIFFPYDGGIFEVKYVQFDQPFYQLGKGYVFEMQCEKFEYSGENFETGISQIDTAPVRSTFPNLEFTMLEGGELSFQFQENVRIFDLTNTNYGKIELEAGTLFITETGEVNILLEESGDVVDFRLYDDTGMLRTVPHVEAKVAEWNAVTRKLAVNDVSDLDPDRMNAETGNVDVNDFDIVLVVGQTSGAKWTSFASGQRPKAFDDAQTIQDEFNKIKIFDPIDSNPFGFW
jgi:hypothetical protein